MKRLEKFKEKEEQKLRLAIVKKFYIDFKRKKKFTERIIDLRNKGLRPIDNLAYMFRRTAK